MPILPGSVFTVQGINFQVVVDGYEKGINSNGPWRKVRLQCDWSDSDSLCDALLGVGSYTASGSTWTAVNPYRYPHNTNLKVLEVSAVGIGSGQPDPKLIAFDLCHLDVHFGVPALSVDGTDQSNFLGLAVPWSTVDFEVGVEEYTVTNMVGSDGSIRPRSKISVPVQSFVFRRGNIPYFNAYTLIANSLVGRLNAGVFCGYPAGCVRFDTFSARQGNRDPGGTILFDFDMVFKTRPYDWNKDLFPGSAGGFVLYNDNLGLYRYAYNDFSPLINFGVI